MAAPTGMSGEFVWPCDDYLQFQEALKQSRKSDDHISLELNKCVPFSFQKEANMTNQCKSLYEQMEKLYNGREKAIQRCVTQVSQEVSKLHKQIDDERKKSNPNDEELTKELRKTNHKMRMMKKELDVDAIVKAQSYKVFHEKCRNAYTPPHKPTV